MGGLWSLGREVFGGCCVKIGDRFVRGGGGEGVGDGGGGVGWFG